MQVLIVGVGALGGTIAARAINAGMTVRLATRSAEAAEVLRRSGLRVSGVGGYARADLVDVAPIASYERGSEFDLILLATKAQDALYVAPTLSAMLAVGGVLLPIQNGGVARMLADRLGEDKVLGGFSNLGATMVDLGVYEQKNGGHLLIGELAGGMSERVRRVAMELRRATEVRISPNLTGAIWSKLLINCSVTTLGALSAQTMRQYMETSAGRKVFGVTYTEALSVALATGAQPEHLAVDPIPPGWGSVNIPEQEYQKWVTGIIAFYGDIKPSMLQDFERNRKTEIDFINGYVARLGQESGVSANLNRAITEIVHRIENGELRAAPERMNGLADLADAG